MFGGAPENARDTHPLSRFQFDAQVVSLQDDQIAGSAAIVTATLDEIRIWSIEGQRIGQFGRDRWDLSVGIEHSFDDEEEDDPASNIDDDNEEDTGLNERLSKLWMSDTKVGTATSPVGSLISDEEIPDEIEMASPRGSMQEILQTSSVRFFKTEEVQPAYMKAAQVGKPPRRMPRDWVRPKKFDSNLFSKVRVTALSDMTRVRPPAFAAGRGESPMETRVPSAGAPMPYSKNKTRMLTCIRDLSATPSEFRPGFVYDPDVIKPATPEIYGLGRAGGRVCPVPCLHVSAEAETVDVSLASDTILSVCSRGQASAHLASRAQDEGFGRGRRRALAFEHVVS